MRGLRDHQPNRVPLLAAPTSPAGLTPRWQGRRRRQLRRQLCAGRGRSVSLPDALGLAAAAAPVTVGEFGWPV